LIPRFQISFARQFIVAVLTLVIVAGTGALSYRLALQVSLLQMEREANDRLTLVATAFNATIARFRYLPTVLSLADPIRELYRHPNDAGAVEAANRYLKSLNQAARSAKLFVLNSAGTALAASNFDAPTSFVAQDYSFRSYYRDALRAGEGHYYAVGATTGIPGYFLSHEVAEGDRTVGVAVVKIDLAPLEEGWTRANDLIALQDEASGVIFLASRAAWKYRPLTQTPAAAIARLNETRQFADAVKPSPIFVSAREAIDGLGLMQDENGANVGEYSIRSLALPAHNWRLMIFSDVREARMRAAVIASAATLASIAILLLAFVAHQRRQAARAKIEAHHALEKRVAERTAELSETNAKLSKEIEERVRAERELRATHENLVQSAKLASLGQALAGVAHEINQPLAALQTYLASSRVLLQRGELDRLGANLEPMTAIAERMTALIERLRMFARKDSGARSPVDLATALRNALNLLAHRIKIENVELEVPAFDQPLLVLANSVRLEQVFINLLSNAMDAMRGCEQRLLSLSVRRSGEFVIVEIADTGGGIAPEHIQSLFDPFFTTKDIGEGLGLGLSISYGIVREFGGTLTVESAQGAGSAFHVSLLAADATSASHHSERNG